ncbi:hypothetical protein MPER_09121, partial [Moniliophthora perniciosa FA553]
APSSGGCLLEIRGKFVNVVLIQQANMQRVTVNPSTSEDVTSEEASTLEVQVLRICNYSYYSGDE